MALLLKGTPIAPHPPDLGGTMTANLAHALTDALQHVRIRTFHIAWVIALATGVVAEFQSVKTEIHWGSFQHSAKTLQTPFEEQVLVTGSKPWGCRSQGRRPPVTIQNAPPGFGLASLG